MARVAKVLLSPVLAIAGMTKKPKMPPMQAQLPTRTPGIGDGIAMRDSLRRRRGAGANELTGGGAEAPSGGGKTLLGQ